MPDQPKTKHRMVRVPDARWDAFGELAEPNRSAVLNAFIAWFTHEPGAKMPKRPERRPTEES